MHLREFGLEFSAVRLPYKVTHRATAIEVKPRGSNVHKSSKKRGTTTIKRWHQTMSTRGKCKDYRIYQTTQNMAVGLEVVLFFLFFFLHACVCVCVCDGDKQRGQSAAESDEMR